MTSFPTSWILNINVFYFSLAKIISSGYSILKRLLGQDMAYKNVFASAQGKTVFELNSICIFLLMHMQIHLLIV